MSRRNSTMSEELKAEIAKKLGIYETVRSQGWGAISAKDCGNIVKTALEMAERNVSGNG